MIRFDRIVASFNRRRWLFWGVAAIIFTTFTVVSMAFGADSIASSTLCSIRALLW